MTTGRQQREGGLVLHLAPSDKCFRGSNRAFGTAMASRQMGPSQTYSRSFPLVCLAPAATQTPVAPLGSPELHTNGVICRRAEPVVALAEPRPYLSTERWHASPSHSGHGVNLGAVESPCFNPLISQIKINCIL